MKNQRAVAGIHTSVASIATAALSLLLLAACAAKPPPAPPFGTVASSVPASTHPVRASGDAPGASLAVERAGSAYRLTVNSGAGPEPAAEADVPLLLPTLVAPDTIAYFELNGPANLFYIQDLVSGKRRSAGTDGSVEAACGVELQAARRMLGANPPRAFTDELASRPAEGACRAAFARNLLLSRLEVAQAMLRERRFGGARSALLAFAQSYPDNGAVAVALFGAGVADYALQDYRSAASLFHQAAAAPSASPSRAAEALLAAADCELELGERSASAVDLAAIVQRYPSSSAAATANRRLAYERKQVAFTDKPGEIEAARFAVEPRTVYPAMSRRLGEQGVVIVNVMILASGAPGPITIDTSSGLERLDQAALDSARGAYFFPARTPEGEKKNVLMRMPIRFELGS